MSGDLLGHPIQTTVDSPLAHYYIDGFLSGRRHDSRLSSEIEALHRMHARSTPSREDLAAISRKYSVDFATLFFAHRLLSNACNRSLNRDFLTFLDGDASVESDVLTSYVVLFVPGWDYRDRGLATGADFARPRALATKFGLENHLVELPPTGSVEESTEVLVTEIAKHSTSRKRLVVVGASSAGPAIHLALGGALLSESAKHSVVAWLNLGGILQGSPLVDHYYEDAPWLFNSVLWFKGWEREAVLSMSSSRRRSRFSLLHIDSSVLVINYLGAPLSGQLSRFSRDKYPILSANGPNDGLTMLADALAPNALTIVALGSDHFFAEDPRIDEKTVALMKLILSRLENSTTDTCRRAPAQ